MNHLSCDSSFRIPYCSSPFTAASAEALAADKEGRFSDLLLPMCCSAVEYAENLDDVRAMVFLGINRMLERWSRISKPLRDEARELANLGLHRGMKNSELPLTALRREPED